MNIPSVLKLFIAVFFITNVPLQVHALTPSQVFDMVKDSIVVVKTLDSQRKMKGFGSGVVIPSGKVATNCHVLEGGASFQIGRGKNFVSATLYAEDGDKDICLLDAKGLKGKPAQLGKTAALKVGVPVYAVGAPQGLELSLSDGIVSQLRGGSPPFIQTTAAISPGSSGGGLFDSEGRLVGLTTLYIEGGQNLNFAMPVEWIAEVKPGKITVDGRRQTDWMKRAIALEELKDWQGLIDWCLKWAKSEPQNTDPWSTLGFTYYILKRYDDAVDAYRQVLRISPKDTIGWRQLGDMYNMVNRNSEAIDAFRQCLNILPDAHLCWNGIGNVYRDLYRHDEAIDAYRQAIRNEPKSLLAWFNLGDTYWKLNRHSEAIDTYRQALTINPDFPDGWFNLGTMYGDLKRYNEAIEAYRQELLRYPKHISSWNNLVLAYFRSGNRTAALDALQELRRLDPVKADELFNLIVPR